MWLPILPSLQRRADSLFQTHGAQCPVGFLCDLFWDCLKEKKMKKIVSVGIVLILAALFVSTPAIAFEGSADAYVDVYSKYLWRGFDLRDENDDFVVQPGVDLSIDNFTVRFWSNISENTGEMNEVDLTLDYSTDLGELVSISVGNILYDVDGASDTNELYLGVSLNTILEPSLTVYYDYDEFNTVYTALGISHGLEVFDDVSLSLGATASYLNDDEDGFGTDESWFHNLELSAGVDYAVNDNITLSGSALYSEPLSDDAEEIAEIDNEFTAGVSLSFNF
jgi:outer membrane scaffolding protein for murein synthesis (MipA/OmpV family)